MSDLIKQLINTIDSAIVDFNKAIPGIQQQVFNRLTELVKDLEIKDGKLTASVANLKTIGKIKSELQSIYRQAGYTKAVNEYLKAFNAVTVVHNKYFTELSDKFKPKPLLKAIAKVSIASTVESLTGAGLNANLIAPVEKILQQNITTGGGYIELLNQLRDYTLTNKTGMGVTERYTKQITTDALNQYAAQYTNAVTNDLGLQWFMYTGALISTSRVFCEALIKKKYIHASEIPAIVEGHFKEFEDMDGEISTKTGLPEGMIAGTNAANFHVYRGGYNCGHQLVPVSESAVPEVIRGKFAA